MIDIAADECPTVEFVVNNMHRFFYSVDYMVISSFDYKFIHYILYTIIFFRDLERRNTEIEMEITH